MKTKEIQKLGVPFGEPMHEAKDLIANYVLKGGDRDRIAEMIMAVVEEPSLFLKDALKGAFAKSLTEGRIACRNEPVSWRQWGTDIDDASREQMQNACRLPVSVKGALMPDAHLGYGLPIGGVLATENAVVPYAVGVDIACRMKMTVLDLPVKKLEKSKDRLIEAIESETRFGIGATFKKQREHDVMDEDWNISPVTKRFRDKAWAQLGSSGSGNHFVEFGLFVIKEPFQGLEPGGYLALLSHSGSRGSGASVCAHYSKLAKRSHPELKGPLQHLAWLDMDTHDGQEYWNAMNLMGRYAAANHACIHRHVAANLGAEVIMGLENHHNFAWKERHMIDGVEKELIVHRKGATPAGRGVLGIIPGSMATPGFVVEGKGNAESLDSAFHGAGRIMSRTKALNSFRWKEAKDFLKKQDVTLISAGLDEVPMVYKDIHQVMGAQSDLVDIKGKFHPRIVKMAPPGERAED